MITRLIIDSTVAQTKAIHCHNMTRLAHDESTISLITEMNDINFIQNDYSQVHVVQHLCWWLERSELGLQDRWRILTRLPGRCWSRVAHIRIDGPVDIRSQRERSSIAGVDVLAPLGPRDVKDFLPHLEQITFSPITTLILVITSGFFGILRGLFWDPLEI